MKVKRLREEAVIPVKGSAYAAGYDLCACLAEPVTIRPGEMMKIPTGLAMAIPVGYAGMIYARSGLSVKHGVRPANCVGVVDSDYRGEVVVALRNEGYEWVTVSPGDRVAQLVIHAVADVGFEEAAELDETVRGQGGFGSTGR